MRGEITRPQCRSRQLDHRADAIVQAALVGDDTRGELDEPLELGFERDQRVLISTDGVTPGAPFYCARGAYGQMRNAGPIFHPDKQQRRVAVKEGNAGIGGRTHSVRKVARPKNRVYLIALKQVHSRRRPLNLFGRFNLAKAAVRDIGVRPDPPCSELRTPRPVAPCKELSCLPFGFFLGLPSEVRSTRGACALSGRGRSALNYRFLRAADRAK